MRLLSRRDVLCGILFIISLTSKAQFQYQFENISTDKGLSNGSVTTILQDAKGFMYFGTNQGLDRYDGYKFKVFFSQSDNRTGLSNNNVRCLYESKSGEIWIGTDGGINKFNPENEVFNSYLALADSFGISRQVMAIQEDLRGNLWLATYTYQTRSGGLVFFDKERKRFEKFSDRGLLDYVKDIEIDEYGNLWLASGSGILIFDPIKKHFIKHIKTDRKISNGIRNDNISALFKERDGIIWATSWSNSVTKISYTKNLDFTFFTLDEVIKGATENQTVSIIKDVKGKLWITSAQGVAVYSPSTGSILNLKSNPQDQYSMKQTSAGAIYEDRSGTIWIGTLGISKVRNNKGFIVLSKDSDTNEKLSGNNVMALHRDNDGILWADIIDQGIHKIDFAGDFKRHPKIKFYPLAKRIINTIATDKNGQLWLGSENYLSKKVKEEFKLIDDPYLYIMYVDHQNNIWGTSSRKIFKIIDNKNKKPTYVDFLPDPRLKSKQKLVNFSGIIEDYKKRIWVSNWQGEIFYFEPNSEKFSRPTIDSSIDSLFQENRISAITTDRNGYMWVCTLEGLGKYKIIENDSNGAIKLELEKVFREGEGLVTREGVSNLYTASIEEDIHGNIWLAQVGLSVLNPQTNQLKIYDMEDGLPGNTFAFHSSAKLQNGYLAFGTTEGICVFHPDSLRDNVVPPMIVLTDFQIFNRSVPINPLGDKTTKNFTLSKAIEYSKEIIIPYDQNVLGFEFAALDYRASQRNQYAYRLDGFDKDWVYTGQKRTTMYTNLDPGSYTFRVKGSNNDGIWNEEGTSVKITILPPYWATWWAYLGYVVLTVFLAFYFWRRLSTRARLQTLALVKSAEANKLRELDTLKSRFFANISHEFRTPLTLILGPLEKKLGATQHEADKAELSIMHRNASRLLALINQLLDFSRLEAGTLKLQCQYANLAAAIQPIASQFSSMADSKKIRFDVLVKKDVNLYYDQDKLEKIVTNLLSNAFKFTSASGIITLTIDQHIATSNFKNGYAEIEVTDTGAGIGAEHLSKIFDRFYQVDMSNTRSYEGSGIGLSLTKELVELHHGTIEVQSELDKGSTFRICLPLGKDHLKPDEIVDSSQKEVIKDEPIEHLTNNLETEAMNSVLMQESILIIEDNSDLRSYMRKEFQDSYKIVEAVDGEEGVALAIREIPTLIISDLMMPKKDGLSVCHELKEDERTSHIPIILLTAKADIDSKLQGYKQGADDYISKPFNLQELRVRIENLITIRKNLRTKFAKPQTVLPSEITIDSADGRFLKKAVEIVESHLTDSSFGVEPLAQSIGVSQTQLYRKLQAVTGFGPNEFIRHIRLHRAADLLRNRAGNVSEVAYLVGFNNLSYFAKVFKEKFGKTPSEFLNSL